MGLLPEPSAVCTMVHTFAQGELEAELEQEMAGYGADPSSGRMTDRQYDVSTVPLTIARS